MNKKNKMNIKIYHGFGHTHDMMVFGHAFKKNPAIRKKFSDNSLVNLVSLLKMFFVKPLPSIPVEVKWEDQVIKSETELDGFFRAEWTAKKETVAGWHEIKVTTSLANSSENVEGIGKIFIPHRTQFIFISDIDDTILVSHSATIWKRLKELLFLNAHTRRIFPGVMEHYKLLANAHTSPEAPNPFFYVSSSEWNLYDYLREIFSYQGLPNGAFLLNQVKRWYELWKTGKTKHEGKLLRILRIFEVFPNQRFILMGDNSQSDPSIYAKLTERYADRIFAIYIRNAVPKNEVATDSILNSVADRGIQVLQFKHSSEAIEHSKSIGLI